MPSIGISEVCISWRWISDWGDDSRSYERVGVQRQFIGGEVDGSCDIVLVSGVSEAGADPNIAEAVVGEGLGRLLGRDGPS